MSVRFEFEANPHTHLIYKCMKILLLYHSTVNEKRDRTQLYNLHQQHRYSIQFISNTYKFSIYALM